MDLLIDLEKMGGIEVAGKILGVMEKFKSLVAKVPTQGADYGVIKIKCPIDDIIRSFLGRSMVANSHQGTSDKFSGLRHFFQSEHINALDPPAIWFKASETRRSACSTVAGSPTSSGYRLMIRTCR